MPCQHRNCDFFAIPACFAVWHLDLMISSRTKPDGCGETYVIEIFCNGANWVRVGSNGLKYLFTSASPERAASNAQIHISDAGQFYSREGTSRSELGAMSGKWCALYLVHILVFLGFLQSTAPILPRAPQEKSSIQWCARVRKQCGGCKVCLEHNCLKKGWPCGGDDLK